MYRKIVIKIGTNVITKDDGFLNENVMKQIVDQVAALKSGGMRVAMVSSGAMGAGRRLVKLKKTKDEVAARQILASVGQIPLIQKYIGLFDAHDINIAQVLATKDDFRDRRHYLNMQACFEALMEESIVPILNENDVVAVEEIMFTDNDELAGLVAAMIDADGLFILSAVDGVYDRDPGESGASVIREIDPTGLDITRFASAKQSSLGRGGMSTKLGVAKKCAEIGITTYILNGTKPGVLAAAVRGEQVGTKIIAGNKKLSAVKKWIVHSEGQEKGVVHLNECTEPVLRAKGKACSLLPVGITRIEGSFEKGDIIKIKNEKGVDIGLGRAEYDSAKAREYAGKKGKKALVHYDYLVLL